MTVYFWVYWERPDGEPEKLSRELVTREYVNLRGWLRSCWPGGLRRL
jgi:hypothetical protein